MKQFLTITTLALMAFIAYSSPIKSTSGARSVLLEFNEEDGISARSYIQDGLIAMWDGIENAGYGKRDTSLKYWLDLVGGKRFVPWSTSSFGWELDRPWAAARMECYDFPIVTDNGYSIDFTFDFNASPVSHSDRTCIFEWNTSGSIYYQVRFLSAREPKTTNTWGQDAKKNAFLRRNCVGIKHCTVVYTPGEGVVLYIGNDSCAFPEATIKNNTNTICTSWGSGENIFHSLMRIGIYSRALSIDEISYNSLIDKERFGL